MRYHLVPLVIRFRRLRIARGDQHGAGDYAVMSCTELIDDAEESWRRKSVAGERQAAKQDLKAIKSAAIAKKCALPG